MTSRRMWDHEPVTLPGFLWAQAQGGVVMVHASCESLRFGDVSPCRLRRQLITWGLSATGLILLSLV